MKKILIAAAALFLSINALAAGQNGLKIYCTGVHKDVNNKSTALFKYIEIDPAKPEHREVVPGVFMSIVGIRSEDGSVNAAHMTISSSAATATAMLTTTQEINGLNLILSSNEAFGLACKHM